MRILLIGSQGQLGWELQRSLLPIGHLTAVDFPEIDLAKEESILAWVKDSRPDVIINAAAYTDVDGAERQADLAYQINANAPGLLAEESKSIGALFLHYSTDYVFDGRKGQMYTEKDQPHPLNVYGKSKYAGEKAVQQVGGRSYIFRTSWLYSLRRPSFVTKVLQWAKSHEELRIVTDQISGPTWSRTLADTTAAWLAVVQHWALDEQRERSGIYHVGGNGAVSRYEWAEEILRWDPDRKNQRVTSLTPTVSSEFQTPAQRPVYSALDCSLFQNNFNLFYTDWLSCLKMALTTRYTVTDM